MNKAKQKKPMGRPALENPASATLPRVRITPDKLATYKQAAKKSGNNFSQWVRSALDKEAKSK